MSLIDYQNGFIAGFAAKGQVIQKTFHVKSSITNFGQYEIPESKIEILNQIENLSSGISVSEDFKTIIREINATNINIASLRASVEVE